MDKDWWTYASNCGMADAYQIDQDEEQFMDKIFSDNLRFIDVSFNCIATTNLFVLFSGSVSFPTKKVKKENKSSPLFVFSNELCYLMYWYHFFSWTLLCQTFLHSLTSCAVHNEIEHATCFLHFHLNISIYSFSICNIHLNVWWMNAFSLIPLLPWFLWIKGLVILLFTSVLHIYVFVH